ncbi:serine hydrolase domain-containing protein [Maribacter sp. 2307ULW6-5]|uniref:serine hydrolase domain-containing protein n=1 Tax=Maribacter sp. 2307ULW6-5 TaxID=3386275 RepID=UPI0039BD8A7B
MWHKQNLSVLSLLCMMLGCSNATETSTETEPDKVSDALYFPPLARDNWETIAPEALDWNAESLTELQTFLASKNTKGFLILKNGKMAMEWYADGFTKDSPWYWASAGKTLTAFTVGLAQDEGYLGLNDRTADHLGPGWTALPQEKEQLITIWHQLTMTSGMDDEQGDCKTPDCLTYVADAGTRWSYHNAPYTLLQDVVARAANTDFETYFDLRLKSRVGMTGQWITTNGSNNVFWSNARSMARFGLLNLNNGQWEETPILADGQFMEAMRNTSQDLNKSYGYLWWLNGKESAMLPQSQLVFNTVLIPNAPDDLYAGLGKNDQKLYIVPSENLVVVRLGESTGEPTLGPSSFDNELWGLLGALMDL